MAPPLANAAPPEFSIGTWQDSGHAAGNHHITLIGGFPLHRLSCAQGLWPYQHASCYRVDVFCDGAFYPGEITTPLPPPPQSALTAMTVRFREPPSGSKCAVIMRLGLGNDARVSGEFVLGSVVSPPLEILGTNDRGINAGQRQVELYGQLPAGPYQASALCNGAARTATITGQVSGQINIAFPDAGTSPLTCELKITSSSSGAATPVWHQRFNGASPSLGSLFGAYYWGGYHAVGGQIAQETALAGLQRLQEAGVNGPLRLSLDPVSEAWGTPRYDFYNDFRYSAEPGFLVPACAGLATSFLPRSVCTRRMQAALAAVPSGGTMVFTAMDGTSLFASCGGHGYVRPDWMTANYAAVVDEYYRLAKALYLTQSGAKTFVVANWETDNMIFCGDAPGYIAHFGEDPTEDAKCAFPTRREGLRLWFEARKAGLDQARSEFPSSSLTIVDGIEFASYRMIQGKPGFANQDALHGLVPAVKPRYALYSAWNSTEDGTVDQDLREIAEFLSGISSPHAIQFLLGEYGRAGHIDVTTALGRFNRWIIKEQTAAAKRAHVQTVARGLSSALRGAVLWEGFDTVGDGQGMLNNLGAETEYLAAVREGAAAAVPMSATQILGVREPPSSRTSTHRLFELYGSFGDGPYEVRWKCNKPGASTTTDVFSVLAGQGHSGQVDVELPLTDVNAEWWCVFRMTDGAGGTTSGTSAEFGPLRSCRGQPCPPEPLP